MKIVIGLGNPGRKYLKTRHNIGFMAVDRFVKDHDASLAKKGYKSIVGELFVEGNKTLFIKPQTYMNLSGWPVRKYVEKYKCNIDDILVVLDDINLPPGKIRIRGSGSNGGHNGLKSISDHLKTTEYPRLRIGVGNCHSEDKKDFVLSRFTKEEEEAIESALDKAGEAISMWIKAGINDCMNLFN